MRKLITVVFLLSAFALLNLFMDQPLDMLTMLGFIILTGVVVNNAILMVEQTLWHIQHDGMASADAILEATSNRIRPIFMSTLTSLFGLLPLIVFPGAGSELYRGIGIVVFGGLLLSTVLALFFIPPLLAVLMLGLGLDGLSRHRRSRAPEPPPANGLSGRDVAAPHSHRCLYRCRSCLSGRHGAALLGRLADRRTHA